MLFHVINLGCKVNKVESDSYAALCLNAGLEQGSLETADVILINTCAVTGEAEKKTRKTVRHACASNTHANVLVTGCSAALHASVYQEMSPRITVLGKAHTTDYLKDLLKKAAETSPGTANNVEETGADKRYSYNAAQAQREVSAGAPIAVGAGFRTRVGIKVQDGCNNACTYCIVHVARGKATSRPAQEILDEVRTCHNLGVKELVLSGINLGSYKQTHQGTVYDLAALLMLLLDETRISNDDQPPLRLRIGSIEPMDVSDELIDVMARANGRICRHLHLPLQSGSTKVLKEMNRPYTAQAYLQLVERLRAAMPSLALSTDIIVGFPGETEEDFLQTCSVAKACGFNKIHVFPYSMREGTPAAARPDQVDATIKAQRAQRLRSLAQALTQKDREKRQGTTEWAVVESGGSAMTESYYSVSCDQSYAVGSYISYFFEK